ncbi:MAG: ABC transporter ATP-binding protein [Caldilineaceae bacterium]|nr:ABC transporter ATP-binding protein [Caldilineaceae bacterium]
MASQLRQAHALTTVEKSTGATVTVERLSKHFGQREVLHDIQLELAAGEFVALIGPSGGGKTTLLRIVAGLEEPTAGTLTVARADGVVPTTRVMFQEDRLLPWQSVFENVAFALAANERPRAQKFLDAVGLGDRGRDWPTVLSGGQKQRVSLARALAHQPDLLLLDEPFGALDALTRAVMQKLLEELWQADRRTVLLITHDVEEALLLADRVIVLQDGEIVTDLRVNLPRPRHRADPWLATHKEELLDKLLLEEEKQQ